MRLFAIGFLCALVVSDATAQAPRPSDVIADQIIKECIAIYHLKRPCACPYDILALDIRCVASAWRVPGGAKPFCYRADVKPRDIVAYRGGNKTSLFARCKAR